MSCLVSSCLKRLSSYLASYLLLPRLLVFPSTAACLMSLSCSGVLCGLCSLISVLGPLLADLGSSWSARGGNVGSACGCPWEPCWASWWRLVRLGRFWASLWPLLGRSRRLLAPLGCLSPLVFSLLSCGGWGLSGTSWGSLGFLGAPGRFWAAPEPLMQASWVVVPKAT